MQTILIVIHLMVVLALVGVVLLQRSEGGGLGIGGGSGFMTARGAANALTRTTGILAIAFFVTSLSLSILARYGEQPGDILDLVPAPGGDSGILDQLGGTPAPSDTSAAGGTTAPATGGTTAPAGGATTAPADAGTAAPATETAPAAGATAPAGTGVPNQ